MRLEELDQKDQDKILEYCERVKKGGMSEDALLDYVWDNYKFDLPSHYYMVCKYSVEEIKKRFTITENNKKNNQSRPTMEQPKDLNTALDQLLSEG